MNFNGETVWRFQTKNFKNSTPPKENLTEDYKTPRAKTELEPCSREEINWSKIEKSIQDKTVRTLQD